MKKTNGRINIMNPPAEAIFALYDKIPIESKTNPRAFKDAMTGNWMNTPLSLAFFSNNNIQILQNGIRAGVFNESGGKYDIGPQDSDNLKIIMRGLYLEGSMNQPTEITQQIIALNNDVINWCVPRLVNEARAYINYKRDASSMYVPIALPTFSSLKGKTMEFKSWF